MATKSYLSKKERDNWLLAMTTNMYLENIIDLWGNNLTADEKRKIKTSMTMTNNALRSIANRMPRHEKDKLIKHSKDFQVRILSTEGAKALEKRTFEEFTLKLTEKEIRELVIETITYKCQDCNIPCTECDTYELFLNSLVPGIETQENCPFAFKSEENIDEAEKDSDTKLFYKDMQANKKIHQKTKKLSKRKLKKIKNRYDEE